MKLKTSDIDKSADTELTILSEIKDRWSPRAFSEDKVKDEDLLKLFEAARWAPSSMNEQPWRFIYSHNGEEAFDKILDALMPGNEVWAKKAPVLFITVVKDHFSKNDKKNRSAEHDLGLSMGSLSIQATAMGLGLHQMAGLDTGKAAELFELPDGYRAFTAVALGYPGEADSLDEPLRSREKEERSRKKLEEIIFHGEFKKV